jgi:hypothetical protein
VCPGEFSKLLNATTATEHAYILPQLPPPHTHTRATSAISAYISLSPSMSRPPQASPRALSSLMRSPSFYLSLFLSLSFLHSFDLSPSLHPSSLSFSPSLFSIEALRRLSNIFHGNIEYSSPAHLIRLMWAQVSAQSTKTSHIVTFADYSGSVDTTANKHYCLRVRHPHEKCKYTHPHTLKRTHKYITHNTHGHERVYTRSHKNTYTQNTCIRTHAHVDTHPHQMSSLCIKYTLTHT